MVRFAYRGVTCARLAVETDLALPRVTWLGVEREGHSITDTYTHGHADPVLASHRWRTAENSAAYLLGRLRPGMSLLDVGCGPGTLTADLASRVSPGPTVGIDREPSVLAEAASRAPSVSFEVGDVYRLGYADRSFDVVHAHQVLQHLSRPLDALSQMRRVLRPGGLLAVRDAVYSSFVWYPDDDDLTKWRRVHQAVCERNGADSDTGRKLPSLVSAAGFSDLAVSSSTWTMADEASRQFWGATWARRCVESDFASQAVLYGLASEADMENMAQAWSRWAASPHGVFVVVHVEVLAGR